MTGEPSRLYKFVKSLFESQGKELSDGAISIEMIGCPRFLVVRLYEDKDENTVEVEINKVIIGVFREYTGQGYRYEFMQRYRTGIRNCRTTAEKFMEDICLSHRDTIRIQKAYSKY